ncbi:MAG: amidohydrolase family protein [Gemmatimonadota bacterium]|nr:MAG: amidohydrolase family protein [Gemmatimonadota bacterium]
MARLRFQPEHMRIGSVLKWSSLAVLIAAGAGIAFFYARGQFPGQPLDGPPIALVGGRIYDPASDSVLEDATVIIRGREIVALGTEPIPDSARILYVDGLTLLPGFIDSHVHLSGIRSRIADGSRELGWLRYLWRFIRRFPDRRRALVQAGVTTVKSLGDPYPWVVKLSDRIEQHELAGPRVFTAGPSFTAPGGHPVARLRQAGQGDTSFIAQVARQVIGPAEAELAVNRIAPRVDYVSVVLERRGDRGLPRLPPSVLYAITATAHERGLSVLAHVSTLEDLALALAAGVDGIEHVPFDQPIDSLTLVELYERRIVVDPTLQAIEQHVGGLLDDTASARRARANLRRLLRAGVPLVVGSDAPSPGTTFGYTFHEELRNLVEAGYTPREAIAAATTVAARHLGLADRLGSIAPGMLADIVAVAGDPLTDIRDTAAIFLVIADGQVLLDRLADVQRPGRIVLAPADPDATDRSTEELFN